MRGILRAMLFLVIAAAGVVLVGSALGQWIPEERAPEDVSLLTVGEERITVDVRNAAGVEGLARNATDHLRGAGFDVVSLGNARIFGSDTTVVIDRVGETSKAAAVARAMGVVRVVSEPDSKSLRGRDRTPGFGLVGSSGGRRRARLGVPGRLAASAGSGQMKREVGG